MINFNIIKDYFGAFFNKGNERTLKAKKNIAASLILKGISIVIGLIYVPLLINYLGTEEYGVCLTLSSITILMPFSISDAAMFFFALSVRSLPLY